MTATTYTPFCPSLNWQERGLPKPGRKRDYARQVIQNRFGITDKKARKLLNPDLVSCITRCKDNAAIRILLGVSL